MVLKNPTNADLTIKFNGVEYSLGAESEKEFPDDVATYWRTKLHQFLIVVKSPKAKVVVEDKKLDAPTVDTKLGNEAEKEVKSEVVKK